MTERERLIELIEGSKIFERCGCHYNDVEKYINELTDYLLKNGVIVPPCKVGDTVYVKSSPDNITECKVYNICTNVYADNHENGGNFWKSFEIKSKAFGITVFPSREEALKALKESEK